MKFSEQVFCRNSMNTYLCKIIQSTTMKHERRFRVIFTSTNKSSWQMCSVKKFLKIFAKIGRKTHVLEPLYSIETPTKVFSCEICQIFRTPILKNDRF